MSYCVTVNACLYNYIYTVCSQLLFNSPMTQNMLGERALVSSPHLCLSLSSANVFADLISCYICLSGDFHFKIIMALLASSNFSCVDTEEQTLRQVPTKNGYNLPARFENGGRLGSLQIILNTTHYPHWKSSHTLWNGSASELQQRIFYNHMVF